VRSFFIGEIMAKTNDYTEVIHTAEREIDKLFKHTKA
jgi:hypothetical protein